MLGSLARNLPETTSDLLAGTRRVGAGEFEQALPITSGDDFGVLAASFNQMQTGLRERERLHAAFGSYVDPHLAERLLEQDDGLFEGELAEVTVMFVDVRDFTAYSETVAPDQVVALLNQLFSIVVPILLAHHGHANKFLGDGVLAVFGVPEQRKDHADLAVAAATKIQAAVTQEFGGDVRIGIGIHTGEAIAGTIGGGGKLEFTLIGDTVDAASRIEQLTKETGYPTLLTQDTAHRLSHAPDLATLGRHQLRGRKEPIELLGLTRLCWPPLGRSH